MKVHFNGKKRKRSHALGGKRVNFFPGEELTEKMEELEERRKNLKLPNAFTKSYLIREGLVLVTDYLETLLDKAESGDLQARRRAKECGRKLKKYEAEN